MSEIENDEPESRDEQELKSDKQFYMRKIAFSGLYASITEMIVVTFIIILAPKQVTEALANSSEIYVVALMSFVGLAGAFMGIEYKMSVSK